MKVLIVGAGGIGMELARILARRKDNEIVIIESDEALARAASAELDALVLHGDGTHPEILAKAGLANSDALVAVTGEDAINTVIAMLAHRAGVSRIVVKLDDVALMAACKEVGVTDVIAPRLASAAHIASVLYGFHRLDFSLLARGGLQLVEILVARAAGKKLSEIVLPPESLVAAIVRGPDTLLARGQTKLEEGDTLLVLVENDAALEKVRELLGAKD